MLLLLVAVVAMMTVAAAAGKSIYLVDYIFAAPRHASALRHPQAYPRDS